MKRHTSILLILITLPFLLLFSTALSLTLSFVNTPVSEILDYISSETGCTIVYPSTLSRIKTTIYLKNVQVETALRILLLEFGFEYEKLSSDTYVVFENAYFSQHVTVYEAKYISPSIVKGILDRLDIENYIFEGKNVFYTVSSEKSASLLSLISQLDKKNTEDEQFLIVKATYISKDKLTISDTKLGNMGTGKNTVSDILSETLERAKYYSQYTSNYSYALIPFYFGNLEMNEDIAHIADKSTDTSYSETQKPNKNILSKMTIDDKFGELYIVIFKENGREYLELRVDDSSSVIPVDSILSVNAPSTDTHRLDYPPNSDKRYSLLATEKFYLYIETYRMNLKADEPLSGNTLTRVMKSPKTEWKNFVETTYSSFSTAIILCSEKYSFNLIARNSDLSPVYAEFKVRIIDNAFLGLGFDILNSELYILFKDTIQDSVLDFSPELLYSIKDNTFGLSARIRVNMNIGGFILAPEVQIGSQELSLIRTLGYGISIGFNTSTYSFDAGFVVSGSVLTVRGKIAW
ncbi:MAG: hypothetical protein WHS64_04660 [Fervidobacterium sp.]|uniref:hypothetical protein n=1 Tax=Fervidobacterium sp. TaxID=1871331 RepID=UPI0030B7B2DA